MEISWLGVVLGLLITAAILFAYNFGVFVGKDRGFTEGFERARMLRGLDQAYEERFNKIVQQYEDEELWD